MAYLTKNNKTLLFSLTKKDFIVEFYRASGNGGQKRNKTETACRIKHTASGAVAQSEDERSQLQNKKIAFSRLIKTEKFQKWHKIQCAIALGVIQEDIDKQVENMMQIENLKFEIRVDDKWTVINPEDLTYEELEDE